MNDAGALLIEVRFPGTRFHGVRRTDRAKTSDGTVDAEEWPIAGLIVLVAGLMHPAGANGDVVNPRASSVRLPVRISGVGTTAVRVSARFVRVAW